MSIFSAYVCGLACGQLERQCRLLAASPMVCYDPLPLREPADWSGVRPGRLWYARGPEAPLFVPQLWADDMFRKDDERGLEF